ncbi:hypothetical protein Ciccas_008866 [Cichlidogyrus casuarinus]|uniref:Uncharacterized protein n=1 Tax=Cichlidogyrus casuarinus TaxID=1844966 RepID=A0ABD2PYS5_9PLAT
MDDPLDNVAVEVVQDPSESVPDVKVESLPPDCCPSDRPDSAHLPEQASLEETSSATPDDIQEVQVMSRSSEFESQGSPDEVTGEGQSIADKFNQIAKMNKHNIFKTKRHNTTALTRSLVSTESSTEPRKDQSESVGELLDTFQIEDGGKNRVFSEAPCTTHHARFLSDEVGLTTSVLVATKLTHSLESSGTSSPLKKVSIDQESTEGDSGIEPVGLTPFHKASGVARSRSAASTLSTTARKRVVPADLISSGSPSAVIPGTPPSVVNQGSGHTGSDEGASLSLLEIILLSFYCP